jgi:hypothetical protein
LRMMGQSANTFLKIKTVAKSIAKTVAMTATGDVSCLV